MNHALKEGLVFHYSRKILLRKMAWDSTAFYESALGKTPLQQKVKFIKFSFRITSFQFKLQRARNG